MKPTLRTLSMAALLMCILLACKKPSVPVDATPDVPPTLFSKVYGGSEYDEGYKTVPAKNGGYMVAGVTSSSDSGIVNFHRYTDLLLVSVNRDGSRKWAKAFGGSANEYCSSLAATPDGGYLVLGSTFSNDGDVVGNHGSGDVWVLKIDADGNKLWAKDYGGSGSDDPYGIVVNTDGSFVVAFQSTSTDGDIPSNHGNSDACLLKCDASGNKIFVKSFGGSGFEGVDNIVATNDGYVIVGESNGADGDITQNRGNYDLFLLKVDVNGNKLWLKTYGSAGDDESAFGLAVDADGSIATAARTDGNDGNISGNHGSTDIWFLKVDASGNVLSSKVFGGTDQDISNGMAKTATGYLITGVTASTNGDVSGNHGVNDGFLLKLDNSGNKQSFTCFGGTGYDGFSGISLNAGTVILAGNSNSTDGDITDHPKGGGDAWLKIIAQ
jgi:hypothetical protein